MKRLLLSVFVTFVAYNAFSQITTRKVSEPINGNQMDLFDSIHDYPQSSPESWIGQTLYVKPCNRKNKYQGLYGFKKVKIKKNGEVEIKGTYGKVNRSGYFETTEYQEVEGKYLLVKQFIPYSSGPKHDGYLLLQNTLDSNDVFAWQYHHHYKKCSDENSHLCENPFIAVSHFNYLKSKYVGETLIVSPYVISNKDIETGQSIEPRKLPFEWDCIDVSFIEDKNLPRLALIIKQNDVTSFIYVEKLWLDSIYYYNGFVVNGWPETKTTSSELVNEMLMLDVPYTCQSTNVYFKRDWENLVKKYGKENMGNVLVGVPQVGMPTHLLFLSEGKPIRTNKASYVNQYIYKDVRYYDENGRITGWN